MFYFEENTVCFSNGEKSMINEWLAQKSLTDKKVFRLLCGETADGQQATAVLKDGKLWFDTKDPSEVIFGMLKILQLPLNRCENCGKFFAPKSRADEKYCDYLQGGESCRKIGAGIAFRKNNAQNKGYAEFMRHTKHLRYLKNKGKLTEIAFKEQYEEAKQWLAEYRKGNPDNAKIEVKLPEPEIKPQTRENIASYLL